MPYTKTVWKDRQVQYPMRFQQAVSGTQVTLSPDEGTVSQVGTPLTAANLNNLENGLEAHVNTDFVNHVPFGIATGLANTYAVTLTPAPTSYVDGMGVSFKINVDSTAVSTLNVNGLGAKTIKKANGQDMTQFKANGVYTVRYNSTTGNFILQGEGGSGNATNGDVLSGKTYTNDSGESTGTMPNRGAVTITPSTTNLTIDSGFHNGLGYVLGDPDLIAANIKSGTNIFGVNGTLPRFATGVTNSGSTSVSFVSPDGQTWNLIPRLTVTGLDFQPSTIIIRANTGAGFTTLYPTALPGTSGLGRILTGNYSTSSGGGYNIFTYRLSGNASVTPTGFSLPVNYNNTDHTWWAFE